jgi:hypothetical protein
VVLLEAQQQPVGSFMLTINVEATNATMITATYFTDASACDSHHDRYGGHPKVGAIAWERIALPVFCGVARSQFPFQTTPHNLWVIEIKN